MKDAGNILREILREADGALPAAHHKDVIELWNSCDALELLLRELRSGCSQAAGFLGIELPPGTGPGTGTGTGTPPSPSPSAPAPRPTDRRGNDDDEETTPPTASPSPGRSTGKRSSPESNGAAGGGEGLDARKRAKAPSNADHDAPPRVVVPAVLRQRIAELKRNPGDRPCALCRQRLEGTHPSEIECELTSLARGDVTLAHKDCFLYAPRTVYADENEYEFGAGRRMAKNIRAEAQRAKRLKCHACKKTGACTGCFYDECPWSFHVPCARRF